MLGAHISLMICVLRLCLTCRMQVTAAVMDRRRRMRAFGAAELLAAEEVAAAHYAWSPVQPLALTVRSCHVLVGRNAAARLHLQLHATQGLKQNYVLRT
jgi:hypothetical protein